MIRKETYSFVTLRYVHDVFSGEFVIVGLVLSVPGRSIILTKVRKTFGRVKNVFPDLDTEAYKRAIDEVVRGLLDVSNDLGNEKFSNGGKSALDYARKALPLDDSSLQWSSLGTGLTNDPRKTFDQLYKRFVTQYHSPLKRPRTDSDVWRSLATKLKENSVSIEFERKRIQGNIDSVEFRRAWKNGRWRIYEPVSFDLADDRNIMFKARKWLGHLAAVKDGLTEDVQLHFIVGRPQSTDQVPAYRSAVEILRQSPFKMENFEERQIDEVVHRMKDQARCPEKRRS